MTKAPTPTEKNTKMQRDKIKKKKRYQKLRLHNDCRPTSDGPQISKLLWIILTLSIVINQNKSILNKKRKVRGSVNK